MSRARLASPSQRMQCVSRAMPRRICTAFMPLAHSHQAVFVGDFKAVEDESRNGRHVLPAP